MPTRLLVVDDRDLIRAGLREFVRGTDLEIVGEASIRDAANLLTEHPTADALILGVEPPGEDGLALVEKLKASREIRIESSINSRIGLALVEKLKASRESWHVLLYSARTSPEVIARAVAAGANGLLLHDASQGTFLQSVHRVALGESIWSREDLRRAGSVGRLTAAAAEVQLTRRESEVIVKMVEGLTNKQIADSLEISYETVKEHVQHVLRKLGVTDRTQAAVWAVRHGLA
ncbi:MAG TPA: response regulator transcription factor [Pirellulaceae bacterium]|nr:response regulator transcription factor [Pirellulaceae bacterium]